MSRGTTTLARLAGGLAREARDVTTTTRTLVRPRALAEAAEQRLAELDRVLHGPQHSRDGREKRIADSLSTGGHELAWLVLAALEARLPEERDVDRLVRHVLLEGAAAALEEVLRSPRLTSRLTGTSRHVRITSDDLVDVHHTARTHLATGIQRVTRETVRRWHRDHRPVLVGWLDGLDAVRALTPAEVRAALGGQPPAPSEDPTLPTVVLVPWHGRYLVPELVLEPERTSRLRALARSARCATAAIGFDCVPVTSSETTNVMVSEHFAGNLSALRGFDAVAAISGAAADEYRGWTRTLRSLGTTGPAVVAVSLPGETAAVTDDALQAARRRLCVGTLPLVLCVGSHEPRKNHLAVLHAAEAAWSAGHRFTLAFVGGYAWNSDDFLAEITRLRRERRPVENHSDIDDQTLWAAYRLARFLVFPSLNEGFGLPVAECLGVGTPVLTSDYGSLAEIAADGGALSVDPRDDDALVLTFASLLTDNALVERLRTEAAARPASTWDAYAERVWDVLREGRR